MAIVQGGAPQPAPAATQQPAAASVTTPMPTRAPVHFKEALRERFIAALVAGNHPEASATVDTAIAQGVSPKGIYLDIVLPAQRRVAELQSNHRVSDAQQRSATEIAVSELGRIRPLLKRRRSIGKTVVVCSLESEPHTLTGRTLSDLLYVEGWEVEFLGEAVPEEVLRAHLTLRAPHIVALSVPTESAAMHLKGLIPTIKGMQSAPQVLVVGAGVERMGERITELAADGYCQDVNSANEIARQVLGLPRPAASLQEYLKSLGERIQTIRKSQQMSQQDVALGSGLERAYISAIEHGKHNITLGAVMKLSDALRVPFEELLVGGAEDGPR